MTIACIKRVWNTFVMNSVKYFLQEFESGFFSPIIYHLGILAV